MKILIAIPAYNCETQITRVLTKLRERLNTQQWSVLVIDNCSTDNTLKNAINEGRTSGQIEYTVAINAQNYGLGGSQKVGFAHAIEHGFSHVAILHGDDQGDIDDLIKTVKNGVLADEVLLGSRFSGGSRLVGYSKFRTLGNHVFNRLFTVICGRKVKDLGSGLNCYPVDIFRTGFHRLFTDDLTFNYCMVLGHSYLGHRVRFFPISWREDDQVSNVKLVSQTRKITSLLLSFATSQAKFMRKDHRAQSRDDYPTEVVFSGFL